MNGSIDWNGIRDFLAVVEAGSLTRAAKALRMSQPTLSRRLAAFEEQLGTKVLVRGPRHLELTDAGRRILDQARLMSREAKAIPEVARDTSRSLSGTVRISSTEAFASLWLTQHLAGFLRLYPNIAIDIVADNQLTDLLSRDADIAVRLLRPTQKDLIARRVGTLRVGFFASESYVERYGLPRTKGDLSCHRVIVIEGRRQFAA